MHDHFMVTPWTLSSHLESITRLLEAALLLLRAPALCQLVQALTHLAKANSHAKQGLSLRPWLNQHLVLQQIKHT